MEEITNFFQKSSEPSGFLEKCNKLKEFVACHIENKTKVVLVTSGGTTVPLEGNTVRYIDNFSIGTRGSASAECFLEHGYAVIFLHRSRSLQPFTRHLLHHQLLDLFEIRENGTQLSVKPEYSHQLLEVITKYQKIHSEGRLLLLEFTTITDYLHFLRAASLTLDDLGNKACLYLAAAVSDFYIPKDKMPQHKIQSSDGPLQVSLELVPKMLKAVVKKWAKDAFAVSFKLETDSSILIDKAKQALEKYQHQLVIGNTLDTRKVKVVFVTPEKLQWIDLKQAEIDSGLEIESKIVDQLVLIHDRFCQIHLQSN